MASSAIEADDLVETLRIMNDYIAEHTSNKTPAKRRDIFP